MVLTPTSTDYHRSGLLDRFTDRLEINPDFDRSLVSYQADKETAFYRWFKYREGFSSSLVSYLLNKVHPSPGVLLDPFAGSGAALFGAAAVGWRTIGFEVLPVGVYAIGARIAANCVDARLFAATVETMRGLDYADYGKTQDSFQHIAITRDAFPPDTERALVGYISYIKSKISDPLVQRLLLFAAFSVLEDISYTRKDGQYLRWDARSGRSQGVRSFDKGRILEFSSAIERKLDQMAYDLTYGRIFDPNMSIHESLAPKAIQGSCLDLLPKMESNTIDAVLTSPPYCNRYDYTRTYALELVFLGCDHEEVTSLRQAMLSCTVENRTKREQIGEMYSVLGREREFAMIEGVFSSQAGLHEVLNILGELRDNSQLNNPHIVRMVRNYFYEMCFVIFELSRILTPGGHVIMVNDNVRYAGEEVPVDLILSSMAEKFGLITEKIWVLPRGKGNSSQQMGLHGRSELRKCVYIWRRL